MSPQAQERWKKAKKPLAVVGIMGGVLAFEANTGLFSALAGKLRDDPADHEAIVAEAVRQADAHAKALLAEGVTPLRADVQELTKQVSRMAGYLEAMERRDKR